MGHLQTEVTTADGAGGIHTESTTVQGGELSNENTTPPPVLSCERHLQLQSMDHSGKRILATEKRFNAQGESDSGDHVGIRYTTRGSRVAPGVPSEKKTRPL